MGTADEGRRSPGLAEKKGRVLVTAPGFDAGDQDTGARLSGVGLGVHHAGTRGNRSPGEVAELAQGAVGAIVSSDPFTAEVFRACGELRVIARLGVGTDSIDLDAATASGVVVTTTPGLNDETCADHTLALMLAAIRRVVEHDASVRRGEWNRGGSLTPWDLHGKKIGVIGYGRIGQAVVRRLQGFSTEIKVFDPAGSPPAEIACGELHELLAWADLVTLHVPLTPTTRHMIGPVELARMRASAVLVNTARGGVVDEEALLRAMKNRQLRAAAIDVFEDEPPLNPAWQSLPTVVLSPHIGGLSTEAINSMVRQCVQQVLDVLEGHEPEGVINPLVFDQLTAMEAETR